MIGKRKEEGEVKKGPYEAVEEREGKMGNNVEEKMGRSKIMERRGEKENRNKVRR